MAPSLQHRLNSRPTSSNSDSKQRGAILIIAAVASVLLLTLLGLALDAAHVRKSVQELQRSA
jgi:Tfp pilus assembly protein PilX